MNIKRLIVGAFAMVASACGDYNVTNNYYIDDEPCGGADDGSAGMMGEEPVEAAGSGGETATAGAGGEGGDIAQTAGAGGENSEEGGSGGNDGLAGAAGSGGADEGAEELPKPVLIIAADTPQTQIVLSGTESLHAKYVLTSPSMRDTEIATVLVGNEDERGSDADFSAIRITDCRENGWEDRIESCDGSGGPCHFLSTYVGGGSPLYRQYEQGKRIRIPAGATGSICLYARMAEVFATSVTDDSGLRFPRSGDMTRLRIKFLITGDADAVEMQEPFVPPPMVLRKATPVVELQEVATTDLVNNAEMDLLRFTVRPGANDMPVHIAQLGFSVSVELAALRRFRFFKGATEIPVGGEIYLTDDVGRNVAGGMEEVRGDRTVFVRFNYEEIISGSGTQFSLRATPFSVNQGAKAIVGFSHLSDGDIVTGTIGDRGDLTGLLADLGIDTTFPPDGIPDVRAGCLFSDLSEVPHSMNDGTLGGSRDWFTEALVEGMYVEQEFTAE